MQAAASHFYRHSPLPSPLTGRPDSQDFPLIAPTSVLSVTQERLMCCPEWVPGYWGEQEFGVPHCLLQHPTLTAQQEETF